MPHEKFKENLNWVVSIPLQITKIITVKIIFFNATCSVHVKTLI